MGRKWKSPFGSVCLLYTTRGEDSPMMKARPELISPLKCLGIMIVSKNDTSPSFRCNRRKHVGHGQWESLLGYGPMVIKCMNYFGTLTCQTTCVYVVIWKTGTKMVIKRGTSVGSTMRNSIGTLQLTYEIISYKGYQTNWFICVCLEIF